MPNTFDAVPTEDELRRDYTQNPYELLVPLPSVQEYERKRKPLLHSNGHHERDKGYDLTVRFDRSRKETIRSSFQEGTHGATKVSLR